jgi:hypothetical protein
MGRIKIVISITLEKEVLAGLEKLNLHIKSKSYLINLLLKEYFNM